MPELTPRFFALLAMAVLSIYSIVCGGPPWLMVWGFFLGSCACCDHPCTLCSTTSPGEIQGTITGVTNALCSDCGTFNATWIMDLHLVGTNLCCWYSLLSTTCSTDRASFVLEWAAPNPNYSIYMQFNAQTTCVNYVGSIYWSKVIATPIVCTWSSQALTWTSGAGQCDLTASTCSVTAV